MCPVIGWEAATWGNIKGYFLAMFLKRLWIFTKLHCIIFQKIVVLIDTANLKSHKVVLCLIKHHVVTTWEGGVEVINLTPWQLYLWWVVNRHLVVGTLNRSEHGGNDLLGTEPQSSSPYWLSYIVWTPEKGPILTDQCCLVTNLVAVFYLNFYSKSGKRLANWNSETWTG
jgi:hypothetical protein